MDARNGLDPLRFFWGGHPKQAYDVGVGSIGLVTEATTLACECCAAILRRYESKHVGLGSLHERGDGGGAI